MDAAKAADLGLGGLVTETAGGFAVQEGVFEAGLAGSPEAPAVKTGTITPLDVTYTTDVTANATAAFSIRVPLDSYEGEALRDIAVLKMLNDRSSITGLERVLSPDGLRHGTFVWTDGAGNPLSPSTAATAGGEYFITVAIEDNSSYDSDPAPGSVADPLAVAVREAGTPDTGVSGGNGWGASDGGSGGGCDTGASAAFALAALALATTRRRGR
jgi:hypothetical protein